MTKRVINRFDPFMPIKIDKKASDYNVSDSVDEIFDEFNNISLNEGLKFRTPLIKRGFTVVFSKKSIGVENEIGEKLLEDFIFSLSESLELPQYLIFMNEAVFLLNNENVLALLSKLKKYGVKNLVSIESLNYFKNSINSKIVIQATSGDISEKILSSKKLINM